MNIKVSNFYIDKTKVWIIIQPLHYFQRGKIEPTPYGGFLCYFKFFDPFDFHAGELVDFTEGEIIMDEDTKPKIFITEEEIESFAMNYIEKRIGL